MWDLLQSVWGAQRTGSSSAPLSYLYVGDAAGALIKIEIDFNIEIELFSESEIEIGENNV